MPDFEDVQTILLLDTRPATATPRLEADGYRWLQAPSLDSLPAAPALVVAPWPQPALEAEALLRWLDGSPPTTLLLIDLQEPLPLHAHERLQRCRVNELPGMLRLLLELQATRQAQASLVATSRTAMLGNLISGIAHDLNNPLTAILGNAELLPEQPTEEDRQGVGQIIEAARRAQALLHTLLVVARSRPGQLQWVDVATLIRSTLDLQIATLRGQGVRVQMDLAPDLPQLWIEGGQLQVALLHLVHNAMQAMSGHEQRLSLHAWCNRNIPGAESLVVDLTDNRASSSAAFAEQAGLPLSSAVRENLDLGVANEIIVRLGGTLCRLDSAGSDGGVRLTLPLRPLDEVAHDDQRPELLVEG